VAQTNLSGFDGCSNELANIQIYTEQFELNQYCMGEPRLMGF